MGKNEFCYSITTIDSSDAVADLIDKLDIKYNVKIMDVDNKYVTSTIFISKRIPYNYIIKQVKNEAVVSMLESDRFINNKAIFDILVKDDVLNIYNNMFKHIKRVSNENK